MPTIEFTGAELTVFNKNGSVETISIDVNQVYSESTAAIQFFAGNMPDNLLGGARVEIRDKNNALVHSSRQAGQLGELAIGSRYRYSAQISINAAATTAQTSLSENDGNLSLVYDVGTDLFDTAGGSIEVEFAGSVPDASIAKMSLGTNAGRQAESSLTGRGRGVMKMKLEFTVSA